MRSTQWIVLAAVIVLGFGIWGALPAPVLADEPEEGPRFGGKIAERYEDSVEWWPEEVRPPEGAPNAELLTLAI
jgi:hypothetical protein